MSDWTGSGRQRREQGGCKPPLHEPTGAKRFTIPAGTLVNVCPVAGATAVWRVHRMKADVHAHRYEFREVDGCPVFRHLGYFIKVGWRLLIDRNRDGRR
jgi:hypothetical protein